MEGVGHPLFRHVIADQGGVDVLCTEFVRVSRAPLHPNLLTSAVVKEPGLPLSVQVMGNDADKMGEAARWVEEAGADVVDINLGCPMPRVVRKGVGAAMLKDIDLLRTVVGQMRANVRGTLSAKIRAGFDDTENVLRIAHALQDVGVDYLVVHPRRRADFYQGVADWRIIRTLKLHLAIPVIGNGDVWYAADFARMQAETGCDGVMVGRPALRNPWIFSQARALREGAIPIHPCGDDVARFIEETAYCYAQAFRNPLGKLKELTRYLCRSRRDGKALARSAFPIASCEGFVDTVCNSFSKLSRQQLDLDAHGLLGLEKSGSADEKVMDADKPAAA